LSIAEPDAASANAPAASSYLRAVLWATGTLAFISLLAIAGRQALKDIPTFHLMFWRSLFAVLSLAGLLLLQGVPLRSLATGRPLPHLWRATSHFAAQYAWFFALTLIPLAQVFALEFTYPLLMALLAPAILGERLTLARLVAAVVGFLGVLVVLRPEGFSLGIGVLAALGCAFGYAFSSMAIKDLTRTETAMQILVSMALIQCLLAFVPMLLTWTWPQPMTWAWIWVATFAGLLAQYCMARSYALADAVVVAPIDFFRLPLIALVGLAVYGEHLDPWVLAGGSVIVLANLINMWSERRG
jgi:drug/metabolite transporter (DMT)-like permease